MKTWLFSLILLVLFPELISQVHHTDKDTMRIQVSEEALVTTRKKMVNIQEENYRSIRDEYAYLNGQEYYVYYNPRVSSALFRFEEERTGSLYFEGHSVGNLTLHYDSFRDKIVLHRISENAVQFIEMNSSYIDSVLLIFPDMQLTLEKKQFRKALNNDFEDGFFEVVYNGNIKYIVKHLSKKLVIKSVDHYLYDPAEYILFENKLFPVRSKKSLIKIFPEAYKKEIKKFLREMNIRIERNRLNPEIVSVINYFELIK